MLKSSSIYSKTEHTVKLEFHLSLPTSLKGHTSVFASFIYLKGHSRDIEMHCNVGGLTRHRSKNKKLTLHFVSVTLSYINAV